MLIKIILQLNYLKINSYDGRSYNSSLETNFYNEEWV